MFAELIIIIDTNIINLFMVSSTFRAENSSGHSIMVKRTLENICLAENVIEFKRISFTTYFSLNVEQLCS